MAKSRDNLGVRVDDYRAGVKRGISLAGSQGFSCVEIGVNGALLEGERLSESGRKHVARLVQAGGLGLASVAQLDQVSGLADGATVDSAVAGASDALVLARDLGSPIVAHDAGELLNLSDDERTRAIDALRAVAERAEQVGTIYAVRSGLCVPEELERLVDAVDCPFVKIAIDPGALLMAGFDPVDAISAYGGRVVHAYARDATRGSRERAGEERAIGQGRLELDAFIATLSASGYGGAPILRRTQSLSPADDIAADKSILRRYLAF